MTHVTELESFCFDIVLKSKLSNYQIILYLCVLKIFLCLTDWREDFRLVSDLTTFSSISSGVGSRGGSTGGSGVGSGSGVGAGTRIVVVIISFSSADSRASAIR